MSDTVRGFLDRNCLHSAGAIAFYTLFAMFPLFLAVISILGYVLGPRAEDEQLKLAKNIADVLPVSSEFISNEVQGVVSARALTGVASVLGLLWASTAVFGAIRKGINSAWGIKKTRPFLKERLIDFALVLGAGVVLLAALFGAPGLSLLKEITNVLAPESSFFSDFLWNTFARIVFLILSFLTFLIMYRYLPNTDVGYEVVWPWALLASTAFYGANLGFVWYMQTFPVDYSLVYGSMGAVIALLTWVYVSAIIVLFGASLASRFATHVESLNGEENTLRLRWTCFSRVRLRVVEYSRTD